MPIHQTLYILAAVVVALAAGGIGVLAHIRPQLAPALTLSVAVAFGLGALLLSGR
ncbi:hypothetical protein [Streptomyces zaomyceticus]|uniref:hypothetical protein n=1 Tax=Streptomyces zaomyceticus TaxID=68286 RepID=UPI002E12A33E|nr:hypothetical protein OG237_44110 [Streptomyces zaomyceticus]